MLKYTAFKFDLKVEIFTRSEEYCWEFLIALFVLRILSWSTPVAKTLLAAFTSKFKYGPQCGLLILALFQATSDVSRTLDGSTILDLRQVVIASVIFILVSQKEQLALISSSAATYLLGGHFHVAAMIGCRPFKPRAQPRVKVFVSLPLKQLSLHKHSVSRWL